MKDPNVRPGTVKAQRESSSSLQERQFLNRTPTAQETKESKSQIIKLQKVSSQDRKETTKRRDGSQHEKNPCQLFA